MTTQYNYDYMI